MYPFYSNAKSFFLSIVSCFFVLTISITTVQIYTQAQPCQYLAYDGFQYNNNLPLHALSLGTGWDDTWVVQGENTNIPGYQTTNNTALNFADLQTEGIYCTGGNSYLTAGRQLDVTAGGAFDAYLNANGRIGADGTTLYYSVLLRKEANNSENIVVILHNDNIPWYANGPRVGVGYFGAASDVGGQRRWSLSINGTVYPSSVQLTAGSTAFLVVSINFGATNTVNFYVNPSSIGGSAPTPTLTQTTNSALEFRSLALYLGDDTNNGSVDEIRFASTYQCATPDTDTPVNLPPVAVITATPITGQAPLNVNLSGADSYDGDGSIVSYQWDFGDGTGGTTGVTTNHTYHALGQIPVSLTVTDNYGLQNSTTAFITVLDQNNSFPCLSSFTLVRQASCNQNNGRIDVYSQIVSSFELRNASNTVMTATNGNEFHNLAAGIYTYTASSATGCTDTFSLYVPVDSTTCAGWSPDFCSMDMGVGLSGIADWITERPFKNLMKSAREDYVPYHEGCNCWSNNALNEMSFDANGYPTSLPQNTSASPQTLLRMVISSDGGSLQNGQTYVLLYDGIGTISIHGDAFATSNTAGRMEFDVVGSGNIWVHLESSQSGNYLRNFRMLRLADEFADLTNAPFYQTFLDRIAPFRSLRFMDWGATNNSPLINWANRKQTTHRTFSGDRGVPYETMIQLANITQKDVWICVPHLADDDFVTQMATLFRDNLNPNLNIYLEYSNEVWNWMFGQAQHNNDNRPLNLNYGRAMAQKADRVFKIWHNVFGNQKIRVKRVLGLQLGFSYLNEQILSQLKQTDWDYASPTWYFGLDHGASGNPVLNAGSTAVNVLTNARNAWINFKPTIRQDYRNIKLFGKEIINYEGGQHFADFQQHP